MKKPVMGEYQHHWDVDNYSYSHVDLEYFDDVKVPALHIKDLKFTCDNPYANIVVEGPVFLAPVAPPYYHMIIDVVGEYEFLKSKYPDIRIIFCSNDNFVELKKQKDILKTDFVDHILKVYDSEYKILDLQRDNVHFKHVVHFASRSMWSQDRMVPLAIQEASGEFELFDCVSRRPDLINFIRNKLMGYQSDNRYPEKIYSARISPDFVDSDDIENNPRFYKDELKVIEYFKGKGFSIINLDSMSFDDQISAFANAKEIAGIAGSNLLNSIFAKPGTRLYQIHVTNLWAYSLFDDYYNIVGLDVVNVGKDYTKVMNLDNLNYTPIEMLMDELDRSYIQLR